MGSFILGITMLITKALGMIYRIPLTNILGGTGMGYYSSAYTVFMPLYAIAASGIPSAMSMVVAESYAFERYKNIRRIKHVSLIGFSFISLLASLLMIFLSYPISKYISGDSKAYLCVIAIAPSILVGSIMSVYRGYYEGLRNMIPTAVSEIIESILRVVLGLGGAYLAIFIANRSFLKNGTVFGQAVKNPEDILSAATPYISAFSLFGVTLSTLIAAIYCALRSRIYGDGITKKMMASDVVTDRMRTIFKSVLSLAFPIAISSVITTIISMIDLATIPTLIKRLLDKNSNIGLFKIIGSQIDKNDIPSFVYGSFVGLALTIFGLIPSLTSIFGKSSFANVATCYSKKNMTALTKSVNAALFSTNFIAMPCSLGLIILSKPVLSLFFSTRPLEVSITVQPLMYLCVGMIFISITVTMFSLLQAVGNVKAPLKILTGGLVIKLILNIILISVERLNINGAAISTSVSYMFIGIFAVRSFVKYTEVKIDFITTVIKPLFAGILSTIVILLSFIIVNEHQNQIISLLISIFFGSIMYILFMCLLSVFNKNTIKSLFSNTNI